MGYDPPKPKTAFEIINGLRDSNVSDIIMGYLNLGKFDESQIKHLLKNSNKIEQECLEEIITLSRGSSELRSALTALKEKIEQIFTQSNRRPNKSYIYNLLHEKITP